MSAEVFSPKEAAGKLPTIVMSHGWGGTAEHLRPDGVAFARAGFVIVAFDYRGWGNSDARLVSKSRPAKQDGKLVAEVTEVRGVVDPIDQTTDILNVLHWVQDEELCDKGRIGIWGSSFSGGHVVYVAARDPRVKVFVSQVGSMDGRWVIQNSDLRKLTFSQGTQRTRGAINKPLSRSRSVNNGMSALAGSANRVTGKPTGERPEKIEMREGAHRGAVVWARSSPSPSPEKASRFAKNSV